MSLNPVISLLGRRLRLAVIGGGPGSFIGAMHRQAARIDDRYELVASCLSSNAERSLQEDDTGSALGDQSQALDQMRQGAQKMAEEMQKNGASRYGQNGETPRDPLGRPQRFQGPDAGNSVKVPDEIDMQRAREILEELRRRVAQPTRPLMELDYFERLLRRF